MATQPATRKTPARAKPTEVPAVESENSSSWQPKGAAAKLAYIQAHIDYVPKTGRNDHQKFDYFQEHGILALVRPFQRQLRVLIHCTEHDVVHEGNMTSGWFKAMLVDTEVAGDHPDRAIWGMYYMQATDNQGWGGAKLLTYGKKFALQKFLGIPAEELPEAEQEAVAAAVGGERPIGVSDPGALAELRQALVDGQADPKRVSAKLAADFKCQTIDALLPSQVAEFKAWVLAETAKVAG